MIDRDALAVYLNDHLAGCTAALDVTNRVAAACKCAPFDRFIHGLTQAVEADQTVLRSLIASVAGAESPVSRAHGWVSQHFWRRQKENGTGCDRWSGLTVGEALDALALGFHGRLALWNVLATLRGDLRAGHDFPALAARVRVQLDKLESFHRSPSRGMFRGSGIPGVA